MPRIVSLIASATEILCALGFDDELVGRSHECDYPGSVKRLPSCTEPKFLIDVPSAEIDRQVKSILQDGLSVYRVHTELLRELRPDVIVTQTQCEVCAVSERDVTQALSDWLGDTPRVISLAPNNLAEVWDSIRQTADALGVPERGEVVVQGLRNRVSTLADRVRTLVKRPTVACIEWIEPLMASGNWMPELVELAGGVNLFGEAGKHAPWMTWEALKQSDPNVILVLPCGFDIARTRREMVALTRNPDWSNLRAVQNRQVYLLDGNQFFNRPGPRLVESLEIVAEILHPSAFAFGHEQLGWRALAELS